MPGTVPGSPVLEFYNDAKIFITGGTGFLGKTLIEKFLRACPNINHIYLLIRTKKGKDPQSRLKELVSDPLFNTIKKETPDIMNKITCINGDVSGLRLNMSDHDYEFLSKEVTHVFHSAATVRFNEKLSYALNINVLGTQEITKFCQKCIRLKVFVHISTAYSNCNRQCVKETYYEPPMPWEAALCLPKLIKDDKLNSITEELIKPWPNTYSYTKAIAENVIKDQGKSLPVLIFRPSIVMGAAKEPIGGWIDNIYGPTGMIAAAGAGLLRVIYADDSKTANLVPVDLAINAILCCAWAVGSNYNNNFISEKPLENNKDSVEVIKQTETLPKIFNFVSRKNNSLTWGEFVEINKNIGLRVPSMRTIWYYTIILTKFKFLYTLLTVLLHYIPAALIDFFCILVGKKPQMWKTYRKLHTFSDVMAVFATHAWDFSDDNIREVWNHLNENDKKTFDFDMSKMDWNNYLMKVLLGIRLYILNETESTLPAAKRRMFLFWLAHRILQITFVIFSLWGLGTYFRLIGRFVETPLEDSFILKPELIRNSS